ncbi:hypothetical protein PCC7424_1534 [Gloeothece citriformis PCC 7424]|uniref:Magnetosome protein MamS/MamX domain-containing protein n=1 Tax=Gloeothece citriformis (strain PCC 7424) TaxID=65393 RepID=B7K9K6_GLOC7|nr:hypothetical protein [Gloeothece citriformis]ACK69974.1 hypothetical protein PCC7424_1534 [Gloeothece citriformis PCC 7424]
MRFSLAKKSLKIFAVIGIVLVSVGTTPMLAQDTVSPPNSDPNLAPCWETTPNYSQHHQWMMLENAPMMGNRGYGRGRWGHGMGMYNPNTVETLTGEVISINSFPSGRGMSQGLHLQLQTGNQIVDVHLGPQWYLENQDLQIQPQDTITVTGSKIDNFNQQPNLIAAEIKKGNQTLMLRDNQGIPVWSRWRQNWNP